MNQIGLGLQVMMYGLAGVFSCLIIFFITIKALLFLFPDKPEAKNADANQ
jgi:hypothetical protein